MWQMSSDTNRHENNELMEYDTCLKEETNTNANMLGIMLKMNYFRKLIRNGFQKFDLKYLISESILHN